ncbi:MAG: Acyl-[acyl-carrier-protein]--UDP-N-acetylglucosamine O-acyltransferase [Verrucomicrobiales bacterium]|nr:Acyl-[acyl-carrier-protein]--UDP-N-acetylglucosamine O-acyltransferase [Verrucomicrobiales bacterium]
MIHKTAVIHPNAQLDPTASVGPYAVIDGNVIVGANCKIGPHVYLTGHTTIGAQNIFHAGAVIGDAPQDLKYKDEPTRLRIGDQNVFREHVTVHRSNKLEEDTVIGSNNFFMVNSHLGHNVTIGNHVIIANGALLAGHVSLADRVFISGNCLIHQFVRIGTLALMQGGAGISKDLPPFTIARGDNGICGLNVVGLRRAGFTAEQRLELKKLYHALFRSGERFKAAISSAQAIYQTEAAAVMLDFVKGSKRGICADVGKASGNDES